MTAAVTVTIDTSERTARVSVMTKHVIGLASATTSRVSGTIAVEFIGIRAGGGMPLVLMSVD